MFNFFKRKKPAEITRPQIIQKIYEDKLPAISSSLNYAKIRTMRKNPTIKLARKMWVALINSCSWTIKNEQGVPDEIVDFCRRNFMPLHDLLIKQSVLGMLDYGWAPFEKIFNFDAKATQFTVRKLKALLHDITEIRIDQKTGEFLGFIQDGDTEIPQYKALLISLDAEGDYLYGQSMFDGLEDIYESWKATLDAAKRYNQKIAGTHFIVYYPIGTSTFEGAELDNADIAIKLLNSLESSGAICLPNEARSYVDAFNKDSKDGWRVELLSDDGGEAKFIESFEYYDRQLIRGMCFPERAILEGRFGSKGESISHSQFVLNFADAMHGDILKALNWHFLNQVVELNFGAEWVNKISIVHTPLSQTNLSILNNVYQQILKSPGGANELASVNTETLKEMLGVPARNINANEQDDYDDLDAEIDAVLDDTKEDKEEDSNGENS